MASLLAELQQRKVFRSVSAYAIVCFVLLQILDVVADPLGLTNTHLQWIIGAMLVGFPLVLYLSWAFDLRPNAQPQSTRARWTGASVALVTTALFAGGVWWVLQSANEAPAKLSPTEWTAEPRRVAVLPLRDLSPGADFGWLAAGVTGELQRQLGFWELFDLTPNSLSRDWSTAQAAAATDIFISGSVQGSADSARVQLEVVDSQAGNVIWTRTFEGTATDALDLQTQIASGMARYFGETMGALDGPQKPEAYSTYLKLLENRWYGDLEQERYWLLQTLELDPDWLVGLAELNFVNYRIAGIMQDDQYAHEAATALQSLRDKAPHPVFALVTQEWGQSYWQGDLQGSIQTISRLLESGSGWASGMLGRLMASTGMHAEAERYYLAQVQQQPFNVNMWEVLAVVQTNLNRSATAVSSADRVQQLQRPNELVGIYGPSVAYAKSGELAKANQVLQQFKTSIDTGAQGAVGTRFTQIFYNGLKFELALKANNVAEARSAADWLADNGFLEFAGMMFLRMNDPRAEATLIKASTGNPPHVRWVWPYAKQHLRPEQLDHPWVVAADNALGYTREFKLELCKLANLMQTREGLRCDPSNYTTEGDP